MYSVNKIAGEFVQLLYITIVVPWKPYRSKVLFTVQIPLAMDKIKEPQTML